MHTSLRQCCSKITFLQSERVSLSRVENSQIQNVNSLRRDMTLKSVGAETEDDGDLTDLLGELRVLLPTVQLLSAFLITVPFAPGFSAIERAEKHVFLAAFLFSIASLVLLSAPAVQHRIARPLTDRVKFKSLATKEIVAGAAMLAVAVVLAVQLVLTVVFNHWIGTAVAALATVLIAIFWLALPTWWRVRGLV